MSHPNRNEIIQAPMTPLDEKKVDILAIEDVADENPQTQLKSELDALPIFKSAWVFRKTVFICAIAGFCAATDGYQNTLSSSIIANKGFVAQFGGINDKGKLALNPTHVSSWGGIFR